MSNSNIICNTKRLSLIIPDESYATNMVTYLLNNKEHFQESSPQFEEEFYTAAVWRKKLFKIHQNFLTNKSLACIIIKKTLGNKDIIGNFTFDSIVRGTFQACYLGYQLDKAHTGQGYMREALEKGIEYIFNVWNIHRIMANYRPTNEKSGRLLAHLGFTIEGYAKNYLFLNGSWKDHILTSLTNHKLKAIEEFDN